MNPRSSRVYIYVNYIYFIAIGIIVLAIVNITDMMVLISWNTEPTIQYIVIPMLGLTSLFLVTMAMLLFILAMKINHVDQIYALTSSVQPPNSYETQTIQDKRKTIPNHYTSQTEQEEEHIYAKILDDIPARSKNSSYGKYKSNAVHHSSRSKNQNEVMEDYNEILEDYDEIKNVDMKKIPIQKTKNGSNMQLSQDLEIYDSLKDISQFQEKIPIQKTKNGSYMQLSQDLEIYDSLKDISQFQETNLMVQEQNKNAAKAKSLDAIDNCGINFKERKKNIEQKLNSIGKQQNQTRNSSKNNLTEDNRSSGNSSDYDSMKN